MLLEELCRLHMHHLACALCFRLEAEHEELKKQASASTAAPVLHPLNATKDAARCCLAPVLRVSAG